MRLHPKHFLFAFMQMVSDCGSSAGQTFRNSPVIQGQHEAVCCLRAAISPRLQPGEILQAMCGKGTSETEERQRPQKKAPMRTIRSEKSLILLTVSTLVSG